MKKLVENEFSIGWLKGVHISSTVFEAIKTILDLFFLRKDFEHKKSTETQNKRFSPS